MMFVASYFGGSETPVEIHFLTEAVIPRRFELEINRTHEKGRKYV